AEVVALLSSLSGIGVRQDIAITGSMNQKGVVQPIGGVNEKIEGFFKVCESKGLTGQQGVIIPKRNLDNLMLGDDIIEAVKDDIFQLYVVEDIDQVLEIMLGKTAETIHTAVQEKLQHYAELEADNYGAESEAEEEENEAKKANEEDDEDKKN
ncbi:MAG: ATP-dependent protease, partial [Halanaerobium sp. MSAO_Bac5]